MSKYRVAMLGAMLALSAGSTSAQEESKARGASPRDLMEWARQIQMDYPVEALRNDEDGTVTMQIRIGADGRVQECEVTGSSGSAALDEGACRGMKEYARYNPARNSTGEPIASGTAQSIRYVLPEGRPRLFKPAYPLGEDQWWPLVLDDELAASLENSKTKRAMFVLTIDEEGLPTGCGVMYPSGDAELDRQICARLLRHARFLPTELWDGSRIPGTVNLDLPSFSSVTLIEPG